MRLGLREKTIAVTTSVLLSTIGLNVLLETRQFQASYAQALTAQMHVIGLGLKSQMERLLQLGIAVQDVEGFGVQCRGIVAAHKDVAYAMIVQTDGRVLFHSESRDEGTQLKDVNLLGALAEKREAVCRAEHDGQSYDNVVLPIEDGPRDGLGTAAVVGVHADMVRAKVRHLMLVGVVTGLVSSVVATFLLVVGLSALVTKPLSRLLATIRHISVSSDLSKRVEIASDDEVGVLGQAFNRMTEDLQRTTTSMDNLNREIAQRKQAEEALRKSETELAGKTALLEAQLNSTIDGILVVDPQGRKVLQNRRCIELWGIPDEIVASNDDRQQVEFVKNRAKDPVKFVEKVVYLYNHPEEVSRDEVGFKDGVTLDRYSAPVIGVDGAYFGRIWLFRDITEQKRTEDAQSTLIEQINHVNKELQDFAYVVSHDLKAPLRGIKTIAQWLSEDCTDKLDAENQEQLGLLMNRVDRMHNLIEGVLQYSRVGRVEEEKTKVDLAALLPEIIDTLQPPAHIHITIKDKLPAIECGQTHITQVFQNLLSNAIKYMDKPQGEICVGCTEDATAWTFSVSDNGPGIEEKYFEQIFRLFQTLNRKDTYESTGIGLTVTKKIVEQYGGHIRVESKVGEGSTFSFTMPKQKPTST
jgi:two-component system sensor kinase FixL